MNKFRRGLVEKAFNILDRDKNGVIELDGKIKHFNYFIYRY